MPPNYTVAVSILNSARLVLPHGSLSRLISQRYGILSDSSSEVLGALRPISMDQNTRCENCGRKQPCEPCAARARQALEDALLDRLPEMLGDGDGQPLILWFAMPHDQAMQHLNRLSAEWPGAIEVLEAEVPEEGDLIGVRVALCAADIGKNPSAEWEVTPTRVKLSDDSFMLGLQSMLARERGDW